MKWRKRPLRYLEIADLIRIDIRREKLQEGDQLPTERELCERFSCSRGTIQQALDILVREGHVSRHQGRGTFVRQAFPAPDAPEKTVVVIVPNLVNAELVRFARRVQVKAYERGNDVLLAVTNDDVEIERMFLDEIVRRKPAGVVKFPTQPVFEEAVRNRLRAHGISYVVVNDFWSPRTSDHHIAFDEYGEKAAADGDLLDKSNGGRFGHGVTRFDRTGEALRFDQSNGFTHDILWFGLGCLRF